MKYEMINTVPLSSDGTKLSESLTKTHCDFCNPVFLRYHSRNEHGMHNKLAPHRMGVGGAQ